MIWFNTIRAATNDYFILINLTRNLSINLNDYFPLKFFFLLKIILLNEIKISMKSFF